MGKQGRTGSDDEFVLAIFLKSWFLTVKNLSKTEIKNKARSKARKTNDPDNWRTIGDKGTKTIMI